MAINVMSEFGKAISIGEIKYFQDDVLNVGREASAVMVESEDQLTELAGMVNPGSFAFTAGLTGMWQLAADGTWVDCLSSGAGEG